MRPLPFDHVAIAVPSIEEAAPVLELITGEASSQPQTVTSQGVRVAFVGSVELLEPLGEDGPISRFLEQRGPGLHHIAYRVDDIDDAMDRLMGEGIRFTSDTPRIGRDGHRVAFTHPRSTGGVLIELLQH